VNCEVFEATSASKEQDEPAEVESVPMLKVFSVGQCL